MSINQNKYKKRTTSTLSNDTIEIKKKNLSSNLCNCSSLNASSNSNISFLAKSIDSLTTLTANETKHSRNNSINNINDSDKLIQLSNNNINNNSNANLAPASKFLFNKRFSFKYSSTGDTSEKKLNANHSNSLKLKKSSQTPTFQFLKQKIKMHTSNEKLNQKEIKIDDNTSKSKPASPLSKDSKNDSELINDSNQYIKSFELEQQREEMQKDYDNKLSSSSNLNNSDKKSNNMPSLPFRLSYPFIHHNNINSDTNSVVSTPTSTKSITKRLLYNLISGYGTHNNVNNSTNAESSANDYDAKDNSINKLKQDNQQAKHHQSGKHQRHSYDFFSSSKVRILYFIYYKERKIFFFFLLIFLFSKISSF